MSDPALTITPTAPATPPAATAAPSLADQLRARLDAKRKAAIASASQHLDIGGVYRGDESAAQRHERIFNDESCWEGGACLAGGNPLSILPR